METPVLGLAYVKTAGVWDDAKGWYSRNMPSWLGGTPAAQPTPAQQPPAMLRRPEDQPPAPPTSSENGFDAYGAHLRTIRKGEQAAHAKRRRADPKKTKRVAPLSNTDKGLLQWEDQNRQRMDRDIVAERTRTPQQGGGSWENQQQKRERSGERSWQASQAQADLKNRTNNHRRGTAAGMDHGRVGWEAATRDFSEKRQDREGRDLDSFTRRMQEVDPAGAAAARRKGDDTLSRAGVTAPSYDWQGRGAGKPIQWEPTTYEQAERMGVLQPGNAKGLPGVPGSAWRAQPQAPQHNAQQSVHTTSLRELPNAPGRAGRALETEDSLREQGVAENGPQGWRYDAARRNNSLPRFPGGPAASKALAEEASWNAWQAANPEPQLPARQPAAAPTQEPAIPPTQIPVRGDEGNKVPVRVPQNRPPPVESRSKAVKPTPIASSPVIKPYPRA